MSLNRILHGGRVFVAPALPQRLRDAVRDVVATRQPSLSIICPETVGECMNIWANDYTHFDPFKQAPRHLASKFDSYVTCDPMDCEATYAVTSKRMPVLYLNEYNKDYAFTPPDPLITVAPVSGDAIDAIESFYSFPETEGRIFVIEGGDGAGKQTQTELLVKRLVAKGYPVQSWDYPHDNAKFGILIREILAGHRPMGNPLLFASLYGVNRESHQPLIAYLLLRGTNIVLDRYMTANFGHQASKLKSDAERQRAIASLVTFEQQWLDLPPPHRVIYLNLPPEIALNAMLNDTSRVALDEHEKAGLDYKNNVRAAFLWCCSNLPGWHEVRCCDESGGRLSKPEVHAAIWSLLSGEFVNGSPHIYLE